MYQTALTIKEVVLEIHKSKYLLPAIQREFVWSTEQIEKLFDSLMRDYPISSFLFWKVNKDNVKEYEFYEFLRNYHEKNNKRNPKAKVIGDEEITAVLDGQQRLTSLYIGLLGSYAYKIPRKRWDNPQAYPERKLYLNLLSESDNNELEYDFKFLTEEESIIKNENKFWFPISKILELEEQGDVSQFLIENNIFTDYHKDKAKSALKMLSKLHSIIHVNLSISYYLEKSPELDKVLNIFIRINSGGTVLSYSDLLLSIATAQWKEKDAREEIGNFVEEINDIGDGFDFNKDFVLKSCLILSDFTDIAFKIDNFNKTNMMKIENEWENIKKSIRLSINLISSFGFSGENLNSNNAVIPIAYYIMKKGYKESFVSSLKSVEETKLIKRWLVLSLLKRVFSGTPDNILRQIRKIINNTISKKFPLEEIIEHFKGTNRTLIFSDEDIENLIEYKYGQNFTFSVLVLLYPSLDYNNNFHIDHIFPKSYFTKSKLIKKGIREEQIEHYLDYYNNLANLQLLEAIPNIEKNSKEFKFWFEENYNDEMDIINYKEKHMIPNVNLEFENFIEFFQERELIMKRKLKLILQN